MSQTPCTRLGVPARLVQLSRPYWIVILLALGCSATHSGDGRREVGDAGTNDNTGNGGQAAADIVCLLGVTQSCLGPGRCLGVQACLPDRMGWTSCDCSANGASGAGGTSAAGSGGAAGQTAQGGTSQGGTSGAGGSVSTGGTPTQGGAGGTGGTGGTSTGGGFNGSNNPNVLTGTISYDHMALTRTLSTCWWCRTTYFPETNSGQVVFQMETGYNIVSMQIAENANVIGGYELLLLVGEYNEGVPSPLGGDYEEPARWDNPAWVPIDESCVQFTTFEMFTGGTVAGNIGCILWGGSDASFEPVEAIADFSFTAVWATE